MQLDFVVVERYILNRAGRGLQDRFHLCFWRWGAIGLPTRKALRRFRRCNIKLRVFFVIYAPSFLSESTDVVLSNRLHGICIFEKNIGYHITYDTRLIHKKRPSAIIPGALGFIVIMPVKCHRLHTQNIAHRRNSHAAAANTFYGSRLGPFGDRNHSI